jgi:hypothetical protein
MPRSPQGVPRVPFYRDPKLRAIAYQVVLCVALGVLAWAAVRNAAENLAHAKIASGFGFWNVVAGFDISQTLIEYSSQSSTFGRAFWVGLNQHAAGRRPRHPVRDASWYRHRHRAAFEELPGGAPGVRICRAHPQRAAAAAAPVLV